MSNLVVIKPIETQRCLGNNGDKYFKRPIIIEALKDDNGIYNTGLSPDEEADLQKHFPYKLSNIFQDNDDQSIWNREEGRFSMAFQTHVLDLDTPIGRLRYGLVKASPFVANSQSEYDEGKWIYAKFIITDSIEEEEVIAKKNELKAKVITALDKMDIAAKRDLCMILGYNTKGMSNVGVSNKAFDAIETKGYKAAYEIIKQTTEYNKLHALIVEAVERHIISKKGEVYSFMDEIMGVTLSDTIEYLRDKKNNNTKLAIINQIKNE